MAWDIAISVHFKGLGQVLPHRDSCEKDLPKGLGKHVTTEGSRRGSWCQRHRPRAGSRTHAEWSLQAPATKKQWAGDLGAVQGHGKGSTRRSAVELILQSGCWLPKDLGMPKALSTFWKQRSWYWGKIPHRCSRTEMIMDFQKPNDVPTHRPFCAVQFWLTSQHLPHALLLSEVKLWGEVGSKARA